MRSLFYLPSFPPREWKISTAGVEKVILFGHLTNFRQFYMLMQIQKRNIFSLLRIWQSFCRTIFHCGSRERFLVNMPNRTERHSVDEIYHVFSKSIAGYQIFNSESDYQRMIELIDYYRFIDVVIKYSSFAKKPSLLPPSGASMVTIGAYCIMPTHIHLLLKQKVDDGISRYMNKCLNSYTKYFNIKHKRKGPLWESRFKSVRIGNTEIYEHVTRYIHLNPSTAGLAKNPMDWQYSSYKEYIPSATGIERKICTLSEFVEPIPHLYRDFVESQIDYQRELSLIKHLMIE